ncbi:MAG: hypothetical protein OXC80_04860, partial [Gammaproteobacteria bacterium]|nr:hypothetical protein [Gammaproteobacteria bacterium]
MKLWVQGESARWYVLASLCIASLLLIFVPSFFEGLDSVAVQIEPIEPVETDISIDKIPDVDRTQIRKDWEEVVSFVDMDGFFVESTVRMGEPVLLDDTLEATRWAILIDTFESKESTLEYRRSLSEQGIESWVSTRKSGDSIVYDIATGPYLERDEVIAEVTRLTEQL